jgi:hypothetical protein
MKLRFVRGSVVIQVLPSWEDERLFDVFAWIGSGHDDPPHQEDECLWVHQKYGVQGNKVFAELAKIEARLNEQSEAYDKIVSMERKVWDEVVLPTDYSPPALDYYEALDRIAGCSGAELDELQKFIKYALVSSNYSPAN